MPVVEVKFFPAMVTVVPGSPVAGVSEVIIGATVNVTPLLCNPPALTTTFPVVAPVGTVATMLLSVQLDVVAV